MVGPSMPVNWLIQTGKQSNPVIGQAYRLRKGRAQRAADIVRAGRRADDADIADRRFGAHHTNITVQVLTSCKNSEAAMLILWKAFCAGASRAIQARP